MVQNALGFLRIALVSLVCLSCGRAHFDALAPEALTPHPQHKGTCGASLFAGHAAISNPLHDTLRALYANSSSVGLGKNLYLPQTTMKLEQMYLKPARSSPMARVRRATAIAGLGLAGDCNASRASPRQVLVV